MNLEGRKAGTEMAPRPLLYTAGRTLRRVAVLARFLAYLFLLSCLPDSPSTPFHRPNSTLAFPARLFIVGPLGREVHVSLHQ
jgi:hypothetical protein